MVPAGALATWVDEVWVQESDLADPNTPPTMVMPNGCAELVVNFGDPFLVHRNGRWTPDPQLSLVGPRTKASEVRASGKTGFVIVRFFPWAAGTLLGNTLADLRDVTCDVALLFGSAFRDRLTNEVSNAADAYHKTQTVLRFLTDLMPGVNRGHTQAAVSRVVASRGQKSVTQLADELGISRRSIHRLFDRDVGLSPKQYATTMRFQNALHVLRNCQSSLDAISECGYFDQAHLIHEFRRITGITPNHGRIRARATPLSSFFSSRLSHSYNTPYL